MTMYLAWEIAINVHAKVKCSQAESTS